MPIKVEHLAIPVGQRLHPQRAAVLSASDIGAAVGEDPYKSPLELYLQKTGVVPDKADNQLMQRGRWLEPAVIEALAERHPSWVIKRPRVFLYCATPPIGATPDAIAQTDEPGLTNIQCKVISKPEFTRSWATPPLRYTLQTLCEGALMDAARSILAVLVIDTYSAELVEFEVPRHPAAEARLMEVAQAFWERIATNNPPPADYRRDTEAIAQMYPASEPEKVLDLTGDNRLPDLLQQRAGHKVTMATCEQELAAIDNEIKAKLGSAEQAMLPGWKISWKSHVVKEHLVKESTRRPLVVSEQEVAA